MTLVDAVFRYRVHPGEREMSALDCVHEVYGVRKISLDPAERIIRVEFDISRLTEDDIAALLRGAGWDIEKRIMAIS
jgi:copper chaperone CopZ